MVDYQNKNSILEHFEYYDRRQANYEAYLNQNYNKNTEKMKQINSLKTGTKISEGRHENEKSEEENLNKN